MSPDEILSALVEAFPRWTFTRVQEVWRANGPVILTATELERDELQRRRYAPIEAGKKGESTGTMSTEPTGSKATTRDAE
ncbi:hypothetical protein [Actinomadura sp. 6N118]|uniref:hypothetical protein n=1 Tax=Actinomadura sp. 6N118 TaxID=3375151 RepID=UPI0037A9FC32